MPFPLMLRLTGVALVLVGLMHVVLGLGADVMLGAHVPPETIADPVLDSQNRFYGVAFSGYGALLLLCATDIWRFGSVLRILGAFIFLGGIVRLWVIHLHGAPSVQIFVLMALELVAVPVLLWWHARALQTP